MKFVNNNDHPIRVRQSEDNDNLRRVRPGEVVDADGYLADQLKSTGGVDTASKTDQKAWQDHLDAQVVSTDPTPETEALADVSASRQTIQRLTVSDPLQRVVGDDEAPHGPPSGTITTKEAVRESGDVLDELAFGESGVKGAQRADAARSPKSRRRGGATLAAEPDQAPAGAEDHVPGESAVPGDGDTAAPSGDGDEQK